MPKYDPDKVYAVPLNLIYADQEFNCRGDIDPTSIIDLASDIKDRGLDQPITLQPWTDKEPYKFRIVAGYRRFKAHQFLQKPTIRGLVKENLDPLEARILNLSENIQRQDLDIRQEANALKPFKDAGWTELMIQNKFHTKRGWTRDRLKFLELPFEIQDEIVAGIVSSGFIFKIWQIKEKENQFEYVKKLKEKKLLKLVREPKVPSEAKNAVKVRTKEEMFDLQDAIRAVVGNNLATRVLGWAAGIVSDREVHQELVAVAAGKGKHYEVPSEYMNNAIRANPITELQNI